MNLTDDDVLKFMAGAPVFIEDVCAVYSATLKEIVELGYNKFQQYLSIITAVKPPYVANDEADVAKLMEDLTDYQYILMMTVLDKQVDILLKQAFQFFTHESVNFSLDPPQIIIDDGEESHVISEEHFYDLQKVIRRMYFLEQEGEEIVINPDDDPVVKRMKMQMRQNREKVKLAKAKQARQEKRDLQFSDLIASITINNCGLNMENIWNITYYALQDQLKRMGWRDQFLINNQAALAGAKLNKKQMKHWIRSIVDSNES